MKTQPRLSIIVPAKNEAENLPLLVRQIHQALSKPHIQYEIVIVDDYSTDNTLAVARSLARRWPVRVVQQLGRTGRAEAIIEASRHLRYETVAVLDADLQYSPSVLPKMMRKLTGNTGVVIAQRQRSETNWFRRLASRSYQNIFGYLLHDLSYDVQSGLKVFRREILERVTIQAHGWSFDLEFLRQARNAGYDIVEVPILHQRRYAGKSKRSLITATPTMSTAAIAFKFRRLQAIPFHADQVKEKGHGFHHHGQEFIPHSNLHESDSAFHRLSRPQVFVTTVLLAVLLVSLYINWHVTITVFIAIITLLYFTDLLFNLYLIYRSFSKSQEVQITSTALAEPTTWPTYTIFCPLYKEWKVLPQFVSAMSRLDYPKEKLQVLLLLEEDDKETIRKARGFSLPSYFQIEVIPHSKPKTKPKALNYGLTKATGEFSVVYDAEDIPDPQQLKKAVLAFRQADDRTVCIQAKLNFYNPHQNILTRVFTAEYSLWFDLVLTGLQSIHAPIPLGGTSNHFRTKDLHHLQGWDAFNVTEDCDLGMRLVKHGYRTAVVNSMTMEEANSDMMNWFQQRTRWIKGYMQTYLVHMRHPQRFMRDWKEPHVITFQLVVGGKILSMFINPTMWIITIAYFSLRPFVGSFIESFFPAPVLYMAVFSLIFGNFLYIYYYMIGCAKREYDDIIKYVFLVPFYWLAMSISAWRAVYEMFTQPHYWAKTKHGLHLQKKKAVAQAVKVTGIKLVDQRLIAQVKPS